MTGDDFGSRFRAVVVQNWNLKLISFAFAVVFYSMTHGGQDATRSIVVDLEALLPPETANRVLAESPPQTVRLTVRGTSQAIDDLRASTVALQIDLRSGRDTHINLEPQMVHGPDGVKFEVVAFDPPSVDVAWEERISRDVPVQVSVVGTPAVGFVVKGTPIAEPVKVSVRGPMSEVATLQHVRAEAFDVTGLSEGTYPRQLSLERISSQLKIEPLSVIVSAEVMREIAERPFPKLPVVVVGIPKAKTLPADVDVRLVCPPEILRGLRPDQVVPRVEVETKDASGSVNLPVLVNVGKCESHITPPSVIVRW